MKSIVGACLLILSVSACSAPVKQIEIVNKPVDAEIIIPSNPKSMDFLEVKFTVVNKKRLSEYIQKLEKEQGTNNIVFYGITVKTYENLAKNTLEMKRYIDQQRVIIDYFKMYHAKKEEPENGRR